MKFKTIIALQKNTNTHRLAPPLKSDLTFYVAKAYNILHQFDTTTVLQFPVIV